MSLLVMTACSNNDDAPKDQLPLATTIGANTAGCLIDGEVLIPKNGIQSIGGPPSFGLKIGGGNNFNEPIIGDDYFFIRIANLRDKGGDGIYLYFNDMTLGEGKYIVGQSNGELYSDGPNNVQIIAQIFDGVDMGKTFWSSSNSGTITVTKFDYFNGVYSGIFDCILYNKDNPRDTIEITQGRFDIKVATLNK